MAKKIRLRCEKSRNGWYYFETLSGKYVGKTDNVREASKIMKAFTLGKCVER